MPNEAADVLVTHALIYYAPTGEALPDETTIGYGEDWGGNWEPLGYTNAPTTIAYDIEEFDVEVEQLTSPLKSFITAENVTIETQLAEINATNLQLGLGGTVTTTAAGGAQVGFETLKMGGSNTRSTYAWGIEGKRVADDGTELPVRLFIFRGRPTMNGNLQFAKAEASGIPISIRVLLDTSKAVGEQMLEIHNVTAPITA